jgi:hypothetical protein
MPIQLHQGNKNPIESKTSPQTETVIAIDPYLTRFLDLGTKKNPLKPLKDLSFKKPDGTIFKVGNTLTLPELHMIARNSKNRGENINVSGDVKEDLAESYDTKVVRKKGFYEAIIFARALVGLTPTIGPNTLISTGGYRTPTVKAAGKCYVIDLAGLQAQTYENDMWLGLIFKPNIDAETVWRYQPLSDAGQQLYEHIVGEKKPAFLILNTKAKINLLGKENDRYLAIEESKEREGTEYERNYVGPVKKRTTAYLDLKFVIEKVKQDYLRVFRALNDTAIENEEVISFSFAQYSTGFFLGTLFPEADLFRKLVRQGQIEALKTIANATILSDSPYGIKTVRMPYMIDPEDKAEVGEITNLAKSLYDRKIMMHLETPNETLSFSKRSLLCHLLSEPFGTTVMTREKKQTPRQAIFLTDDEKAILATHLDTKGENGTDALKSALQTLRRIVAVSRLTSDQNKVLVPENLKDIDIAAVTEDTAKGLIQAYLTQKGILLGGKSPNELEDWSLQAILTGVEATTNGGDTHVNAGNEFDSNRQSQDSVDAQVGRNVKNIATMHPNANSEIAAVEVSAASLSCAEECPASQAKAEPKSQAQHRAMQGTGIGLLVAGAVLMGITIVATSLKTSSLSALTNDTTTLIGIFTVATVTMIAGIITLALGETHKSQATLRIPPAEKPTVGANALGTRASAETSALSVEKIGTTAHLGGGGSNKP